MSCGLLLNVRARVLQRVDKALLGGASCLVPFKDAGVVEHVAKHHADLLVQDVDGVIRRKFIGAACKDILGPCGVAAAKVVALERAAKVVAGVGLGGQQVLADGAELGNQAWRQEWPGP